MKTLLVLVVLLGSVRICAQDGNSKTADASRWDLEKLNTGKSASFLSDLEKDVLLELNKVRTNPKLYAELYVTPVLVNFRGNLNTKTSVETREGIKAVKECIDHLGKTRAMTILSPEKELYKAAAHHTALQSKTRETGHDSPNGETFADRLRKAKFSKMGECIAYGEKNGRDIVVALLIDDGVPTRGHRKNVLDPLYLFAGISAGGHKTYSTMCTIDFGGAKPGAVKK